MPTTYRGKLPKPDAKGDWRPEVGGKRFNIGHRSEVSEGEALRRLDAIRDLFERQCQRHQTDRWEVWLLDFAKRLAKGDRTVDWEVTQLSKQDAEDAAEEAMLLDELRALGFDVRSDDPATLAKGRQRVQEWIQAQVKAAVTEAIRKGKADADEHYGPVATSVTSMLAEPECFETRTLHEAFDAFKQHLEKTGTRDAKNALANSARLQLKVPLNQYNCSRATSSNSSRGSLVLARFLTLGIC